ncbi:LppY/LpqO family protein [Pseudoneobacillus sp. C159]
MDNNQPDKLCQEFADILGATPGVVNGVCTATKFRTNLHPIVLGRRAESFMFVPQAFSYENIDKNGRALCLGETVILEEEINPFLSVLRRHGIIVTAIHNHWLFDEPRLMYMHFEAIDEPLNFARNVRDALDVLTTREIGGRHHFGFGRGFGMNRHHGHDGGEELCEEFHQILGGMSTFENGVCTVMRARTNIRPTVLGRRGQSFLLIPQMFTFESLERDGTALCSGESVILEEEFNPLASKLRQHGIFITAFHNHWLFDEPRLMYIHFLKIDEPICFADAVKDSFRVLTTETISCEKG